MNLRIDGWSERYSKSKVGCRALTAYKHHSVRVIHFSADFHILTLLAAHACLSSVKIHTPVWSSCLQQHCRLPRPNPLSMSDCLNRLRLRVRIRSRYRLLSLLQSSVPNLVLAFELLWVFTFDPHETMPTDTRSVSFLGAASNVERARESSRTAKVSSS